MKDYLIQGSDYLAQSPGFALLGRKAELAQLSSILVRKHSSSVILVAPAGVGVTSICMGLQELKGRDDAPFDLVSKTLFWLDSNGLFATGKGDDIEKSFRTALSRLESYPQPVLVIEDAGDFIDGCRNVGALHFVNLLNAAVNTGRLQVIFETSDGDIDKLLKWHADIRESYTIMDVQEPDTGALLEIVTAAARKLEAHHDVRIDPEAVMAAIELTQKYRTAGNSRYSQPKRSISLLDRAMSAYRLKAHETPPSAAPLKARIEAGRATEDEKAEFERIMRVHADRQKRLRTFHRDQREAEEQILLLTSSQADLEARESEARQSRPEAEPAPKNALTAFASMTQNAFGSRASQELATQMKMWKEALSQHREGYMGVAREINADLILCRTDVMSEFSAISGMPIAKLGENDMAMLRNLEADLKACVFGQDHAVESFANAVKVARVGRRNKDRPQASFMFPGPSGVGKTEIAKQAARILLGSPKALTRFDMSEYMERHAVSKLIGAPPGYEGFEAGGILTNAMRENRNRIILFDETEKAHPDVFKLLLHILDDGRLTDNIGRVAEFSDAIIIMTTNIGQPNFLRTDIDYPEQMELALAELEETYLPEFLNRINGRENIIGFKRLEMSSVERIITREIEDLVSSYAAHGVTIEVAEGTVSRFCEHRYQAKFGARGLPGVINSQLEPQIVNVLIGDGENETSGATESKKMLVSYDASIGRFSITA